MIPEVVPRDAGEFPMHKRDGLGSVFSRAKRGLSRFFFGTNGNKALKRRKRRRLRLERRAARPVSSKKPVIPRPAKASSHVWRPKASQPPGYDGEYLAVWLQDIGFLKDPRFLAAYQHGMSSGHQIGSYADRLEWRAHPVCWAAAHAQRLPGDFVE